MSASFWIWAPRDLISRSSSLWMETAVRAMLPSSRTRRARAMSVLGLGATLYASTSSSSAWARTSLSPASRPAAPSGFVIMPQDYGTSGQGRKPGLKNPQASDISGCFLDNPEDQSRRTPAFP